ncbi:MAG: cytochrome b [Legionellales bacterium]
MHLRNSKSHFGLIAILLHWIMALLIIGLLALGLYMVFLPISLEKLKLYGWHKEYGFLALALVTIRLIWRLINVLPSLSLPWYELIAARLVHWAFYAFMFAMPISGWLVTSAAGLPASFFGLFTLPNLIEPNEELRQFFALAHKWLGYALIITIILHTSAALKHHFINKDNILRRMIS